MEREREAATAPGDLPESMVVRRYASAVTQLRHENTVWPLRPRPDQEVTVIAASGAQIMLERATLYYTADGSLPDHSSTAVPMRPGEVSFQPFGEYQTEWRCTLPGQPDGTWIRYRIVGRTSDGDRIDAQDGQGFWFRYPADQSVRVFSFRVSLEDPEPTWFHDAIIYQIFVDRFRGQRHPEAGARERHGGTLEGIRESLPHIRNLGATCIWLSPVGIAPSYHRYDATDLMTIDPDLGDKDDLRALVDDCHANGIRVILDFVPSHFSDQHPAFREALQSRDSQYSDWFTFYNWPHEYRSFLESVPSLVSVNTESVTAREYIKKAARYWIEECDVDGYRIDHVVGHGMDFWNDLQIELETIKPDVLTLAEATDTGDAILRYAGKTNAILDFPLARALRLTFATRQWDVTQLDAYITQYERFMQHGPARAGFLDNHDMERFLYVAGQDARSLALAALCLMTLASTPVIYYGTEIGMSHEHSFGNRRAGGDAQARADMIWNPDHWDTRLFEIFQKLAGLRTAYASLRRGTRTRVALSGKEGLYHYSRVIAEERTDVAFLLGSRSAEIAVPSVLNPVLAVGDQPSKSFSGEAAHPELVHWTLAPGSGVLFASESH